uniref:hypothetical protein n=1 Tax=Staphylococcus aureus TaxID=1280 RepID=UPI0038B3D558
LGTKWPNSLALFTLDYLTDKSCTDANRTVIKNSCRTTEEFEFCRSQGFNCVISFDGFYKISAICFVIGMLWYGFFRKSL